MEALRLLQGLRKYGLSMFGQDLRVLPELLLGILCRHAVLFVYSECIILVYNMIIIIRRKFDKL